jgi:hypothetical protein
MSGELVHLESDRVRAIEDPLLEELEAERAMKAALTATMGRRGGDERDDEQDEACEFDLEVMKPRAVDIRALMQQQGEDLPPALHATLGPRRPLLLYHGFTPFHKRGASPTPIWGMGYDVRLKGVDGATVSIEPGSAVEKVGEIEQNVSIGLDIGGELQLAGEALELLSEVPGFSMKGVKVFATTHNRFSLALHLELSLLKVVAGPVGAGGARWDIYRTRERLDHFQPLVQTLLVPEDTERLHFEVETWIRRRGKFFGLISAREWTFPGQEFDVSLEGAGR